MRVHTLAASVVLACGAPSPPAPVQPPTREVRAVLAPGAARYQVRSHLYVEQDVGGRIQESRLDLAYFVSADLASDTAGAMIASLVLDSVTRFEGNAATATDFRRAHGSRFSGRLSPTGDLAELSGGDSTVRFLRELTDELRLFFPRLPPGGASPGTTWVDTTEQRSTSSGIPLSIRQITEHRVGDPEAREGALTFPIRRRTTYTFGGTGTQGGQEFQVAGSGRRSTVEFLSVEGRYLGLVTADTSTFTITLGVASLEIPGRQTRADTVSVVP
ncbi:MAG TPA: hypothetical protein VNL18_02815 [Gemmatimonadales bacterium]|nr:hypothetical protein [Gemmatimonadales bacterium]